MAASRSFELAGRSLALNRVPGSLMSPDAALSPRRATYCSFASPKESRQRKGDPGVCVPSLRFGQPAVLGPAGVSCKLAALKQARALIRLALCSSAQPQGFCGTGSGSGSNCVDAIATIFIAVRAGTTWARGRITLRTGRGTRFWESDHNFAAQHPQGAPTARRIWALTPKTPLTSARLFFGLPYFGEAKKGESPAAATERHRNVES